MTTKAQGACMACRARKVKCTPGTLRCARCTAMDIQDCSYTTVKKRGVGKTLRMGQACIPCRERKNRCDARQPCTTCVKKNRAAMCRYEGSRSSGKRPTPRPKDVLVWSDSKESGPSHSLPLDLRGGSSINPGQSERETLPPIDEKVASAPLSDGSVAADALGVTECPLRPTATSFAILPSISFQTVPRPLRIPLSLVPPERVQVSWVSGSDLDMTLGTEGMTFISRLRALCRLSRVGLYFTTEKQEALLHGDISNTIVHRNFVYGLQIFGVHVCGVPDRTPFMVQLQAGYVRMAFESLVQLNETDQERTKVQALVAATHASTMAGFVAGAQLYLLSACEIVKKAKLQLLPGDDPSYMSPDQVREYVSALSQLIYLENYFYLTSDGPEPMRTAGIEREFRLDLERVYPLLFDICPLTMRTQSILLARDAVSILDSVDQNTISRSSSYLNLVRDLERFSGILMKNMELFINLRDASGAETIWTCCVVCLAHLAALSHQMSQTDLASSVPVNDLYDVALGKLGSLSLYVRIEVYSPLDLLLGVSWKRALDTIDARIELGLDTEDGSLRSWRIVIGKAYADLQAHLLGSGHNLFASLVVSTEGLSEGSNFPDSLMPREKERHGV